MSKPTTAHLKLHEDLKDAIRLHPSLPIMEALAITCQLVGGLVALQDQTKYTPEQIMNLVAINIEIGNATAMDQMFDGIKGHA